MKQPEIRFNGFSDEWVGEKLGEIANLYQPKTISSNQLTDSGFRVFGANGYIGYYSESNHVTDQVTISARGNVGLPSYVEGPVWITGNSMVVNVDDKPIDKQFLYSSFLEHDFKKYVTGSVQPQLTREALASVSIQLPTLPEQQKIGSLFSKYDAIIGLREQKLEELNALKKGLLQQMFPEDGVKVPELRFAGFADDWEEKTLGDVYSFSKGLGISKQSVLMDESLPKGIPYGDLFTIYNSVIKEVEWSTTDINGPISNGTEILIPASSTVPLGPAQVSAILQSGVRLGGDIIIGKPLNNNLSNIFVAINATANKHKMYRFISGSTISHISASGVANVPIQLPTLSEQQKIGQLFKNLDARISNEQTKIEQLKDQKQGLLQRML